MKNRKCIKCNIEKELITSNFTRNSNLGGGRYNKVCKVCKEKDLLNDHWKDGKLKCFICLEYLPEECFNKAAKRYNNHRNNKDSRCSSCKVKQSKLTISSKDFNDSIKHIINSRLLGARSRSKAKKLDFNLDYDYIQNLLINCNYKCSLTDQEMTFSLGKNRVPTNMSIDRLIPKLGYVKGNIQLVCSYVNQFKNDQDNDYFINICKLIAKKYENKNN